MRDRAGGSSGAGGGGSQRGSPGPQQCWHGPTAASRSPAKPGRSRDSGGWSAPWPQSRDPPRTPRRGSRGYGGEPAL